MDFYKIKEKSVCHGKKEVPTVYPDFKVCRSKDLMVRGKSFYAIWDEEKQLWSTDEYDVSRIIDASLDKYIDEAYGAYKSKVDVKYMSNFSSKSWVDFKNYVSKVSDNYHEVDSKIVFDNTPVKKEDYISRKLPYSLCEGSIEAYDEMMSTLYSDDERAKIEWAIGSIIAGDSKKIQKFLVLYGDPGTGKSTVLEIVQKLFPGYYTIFEAKALTSSSNIFSTETFKSNPLIAIQHDGDLSRIEDNSKLNSIVSHEEIIINEKYKSSYPMRVNCLLFMATNKPVKITDAKAGLIRRLIDVRPTGRKLPPERYFELREQVDFELGAIAKHCLDVYLKMGKDYYSHYRPVDMMYKTDPFFNFVEDSYDVFADEDGVSLKRAYAMYQEYCEDTNADYKLQRYKFREELKNYFEGFDERYIDEEGNRYRSYYHGFLKKKFQRAMDEYLPTKSDSWIRMKEQRSNLDSYCSDCLAQYANNNETPSFKWTNVKTTLKDLTTTKLHYVKLPENHIVIDFDLKGDDGFKSLEKNVEAASHFPKTYCETSKSGSGLHLHYIYDGDVTKLSRIFDDSIEIKVFTGNSSLRRKVSLCNNLEIATINSGLPLKKEAKMINYDSLKDEKYIRTLIKKNLNKEIHPYTKPSVDFIKKILDDAYDSGISYDVTDMRPAILSFALCSSNQSSACLKIVHEMKFKSENTSSTLEEEDKPIIFYDVEVFPNLFLVNWKKQGAENKVTRMINPTPAQIEDLLQYRLVGFNCRRYDNHIMYARMMGYTNEELYRLSQRIIEGSSNASFLDAYNLSYADVFDFSSVKQSLKKFEIELGIFHKELEYPWDQPVPEEKWSEVAAYCDNDVIATEAVWENRQEDFMARQILADLSGLTVNDTTRQHVTKIIFGNEKHPKLVYTDLSETFPGYEFVDRKNMYRGVDMSFGGYVYAEEGMHVDVALLDIESLHPNSAINLNYFGEYTEKFKALLDARIFIKHGDYESAGKLLDGALKPYLTSKEQAGKLAQALKIVINSVYGYTSASFANPFRDPRNVNNIIALRGALFMKTLEDEVKARGFTVAHIKTDSIKIPNATLEIINFCKDFARQYGYRFEHEATYKKMCLVNDAVYIAKYATPEECEALYGAKYMSEGNCKDNFKHVASWTATGTQFQVPYVFKTLFSKEDIVFEDLCETKTVSSAMYLDFNEGFDDVTIPEKIKSMRDWEVEHREDSLEKHVTKRDYELFTNNSDVSDEELEAMISLGHDYRFVGKVGRFCPVKDNTGGALLLREKDGKYYAVTGTKGYRWKESCNVKENELFDDIDRSYYNKLVDEAVDTISKYGDVEEFIYC